MNVYVCVGSSCHLKNSKGIIDKLTKLIEENNIKANVELKGSFCMGQCGKDGVSVKIDDEVYSVTEEDVEMFFEKKILYETYSEYAH